MINYTVHIDTLKLQIDFINSSEQREVMDQLARALDITFPFLKVKYNTNTNPNGAYTHTVNTGRAKILELTSGAYKDKYQRTIYFITIEIAGLKQYHKNDKIAYDCLIRLVAYLNTNEISFEYKGIDVAVDLQSFFAFTYVFCNKKAPRVQYYSVYEKQPYLTTRYIEKYINTHNQVMKRSKLYYKPAKDKYITYPITRYELKLQSSFFNKYPYRYGMLQNELDRYHILYFPTLDEKAAALELYSQYEESVRRRDLHKLGLDRYRLYPNTSEIENFLFDLYDVYEHDLDLPVEEENSDWLDEY
ncbi:hypothetical protein [Sulfurimonas sp.]|jgi:hypothetical protein|uniref:hypothetical protein n=1 Tax=Sulfurimonas sp. TaxID=2022749 RepID=UPI002A371CAA|nr:hypothetical protein [Sulfurimonas sp.]MDY0122963.1 hypothetical protein [Sulfurimonas sp.]